MKIVNIVGGLGNQMFQYAFYCALKEHHNNTLIDLSSFKRYNLHNGFELSHIFNITPSIATNEEIKKLTNLNDYSILSKLKRKMATSGIKIILKESEYLESSPIPNLNIFDSQKDMYYWGYFQSEKYFSQIKNQIISTFTFSNQLDKRNLAILKKIQNTKSVSVHIRRGDYLIDKQFKNICTLYYYKKAIEYQLSKDNNLTFYIFSDDITWVKNNFSENINCEYIDWNIGSESYKDMKLMSMCHHNIIANSSFSWWGAWLNTNKNKIVIAPKKWNNTNSHKAESIIPETWIKL